MSEELLVEEAAAVEETATEEAVAEETVIEEEIVIEEEAAPEETPEEEEPAEETEKKIDFRALIKQPQFWKIAVGALLAICALVVVLIALKKPADTTAAPETQATTPKSTAAPTDGSPAEPTYLPIDRNPIGLSDFYMDEYSYLHCMTTPSVVGIDVSEWQGSSIDWQKVKESGVEFVIIRVGWRGSEQGVLTADTYAQSNYAGASAAGLKVGAYIFSQAITPEEAVEEANYLMDAVKDWNIEMPLVFDWEYIDATSRTANMDARTLTDCAIAFCETVKNAGYTPMVYFNTNQSMEMLYLVELDDYLFWLAQYDTVLRYDYKIDMWQYTESGTVPGIPGPVDIDLYFPYEE